MRSFPSIAQVVKLVDTLASGASARKGMEVQVLSWAPLSNLTASYKVRALRQFDLKSIQPPISENHTY